MTRHRDKRAVRGGFTLIELLVVIAIIGVVTVIIVSGTMAFRKTVTNRASDDKLNRFQIALNDQYGRVVDKGNSSDPPRAVIEACGGNKERARAVHTAAMLRVAFPDTFAEATTGFTITGTTPGVQHIYEPKPAFKVVGGTTLAADEESAVLLYLILSERAEGGSSADAVSTGETTELKTAGKSFTVLLDSRKVPIAFRRWARNTELDQVPGDYAIKDPKSGSIDPLDPQNLVTGVYATTFNKYGLMFNGRNRMPTVISLGENKANDNYGGDDRIGYRLNRFGKKGNVTP